MCSFSFSSARYSWHYIAFNTSSIFCSLLCVHKLFCLLILIILTALEGNIVTLCVTTIGFGLSFCGTVAKTGFNLVTVWLCARKLASLCLNLLFWRSISHLSLLDILKEWMRYIKEMDKVWHSVDAQYYILGFTTQSQVSSLNPSHTWPTLLNLLQGAIV